MTRSKISIASTAWLLLATPGLLAAGTFDRDAPLPAGPESGTAAKAVADTSVLFDQVISMPGATWMRFHFTDTHLSAGSYLRLTALVDDAVQVLDTDALAEWNDSSAYFNGDGVRVELIAADGAAGDQVGFWEIESHIRDGSTPPCETNVDGICDGDGRVPSAVMWAARMLPSNCTASIYNEASCAVTAGHCLLDASATFVLQFQTPASDADCALNHPAPIHQFPVTGYRREMTVGPLNDWGALAVGANHEGRTPYESYGELRPIATERAGTTEFVEIWAYGRDNDVPAMSQTQQYCSGAVVVAPDETLTFYRHNADIIVGSSGGAIIHDGAIIAIQSSSQGSFPCGNPATVVDLPAFINGRVEMCGGDVPNAKSSWGSFKSRYR